MTITHKQLCRAADAVLDSERLFNYSGVEPSQRYDWLTEVELTARLRATLVVVARVPSDWLKLNAQGRRAPGVSNANIEEGNPLSSAIGVSYCWKSPGKPLSDDLEWMAAAHGRHVLAYFPRMRTGYAVQNNPELFEIDGSTLRESTVAHILSKCIQIGGLTPASHSLCKGVFDPVKDPATGRAPRWSLSPDPQRSASIKTDWAIIERSIIGSPNDNMWAIAWSQE